MIQMSNKDSIHLVTDFSGKSFKTAHFKETPDPSDFEKLIHDNGLLDGDDLPLGLRAEIEGTDKDILYIARPDVIQAVLRNSAFFGLANYDEAFDDVTFVLSDNDAQYALKRKILAEIFGHNEHTAAIDDLSVSETAKAVSQDVARAIKNANQKSGSFDIIRDYGSMIVYLVSCRVFGLRGRRRAGLTVWILRTMRAIMTRKRFRFTPLSREMQNMITACQIFFLQLFRNFRNESTMKRRSGNRIARQLQRDCQQVFRNPSSIEPNSFAAKLAEVKQKLDMQHQDGASKKATRCAVEELLLEFVTTLIMIVFVGFIGSLRSLQGAKVSLSEAQVSAADPDTGTKFINELLRINSPTGAVFRRAKTNCQLGGERIEKDEDLVLLIGPASVSSQHIPDPSQIKLDRDECAYLHFGPFEGVHACLGQNWAKEIIRQALIGLSEFENPKLAEAPRTFQGAIESWDVNFG